MATLPPCGPSVAGLSAILEGQASIADGLILAGQWWSAAAAANQLEGLWREPLVAAAGALLTSPEDDLFSSGADDLGAVLLEVIGYEAPSSSAAGSANAHGGASSLLPRHLMKGPALKLSASRARFKGAPPDFFRATLKNNPSAAKAVLGSLGSGIGGIRLDRLFQGDTFPTEVLAALNDKTDKHLCSAIGVALEHECLESKAMPSPGAFERASHFARMLAVSSIVPFNALAWNGNGTGTMNLHARPNKRRGSTSSSNSIPAAAAVEYFSGLANFPTPSGQDAHDQMNMVRGNATLYVSQLAKLMQRTLTIKELREGVLAWFSRCLQLAHSFFHKGGHQALQADASSHPEACSSSLLLNATAILLELCKPLCDAPSKFVGKIEPGYLEEDWRIPFSSMPKLNENEGGSGEHSEHIDGGDDNKDGKVATTDNDDDDDDDDDDALLAAALAMSVSAHADPGFFPHQHTNYRTAAPDQPYSFVTEVFWLCARAMELLPKLYERSQEQLRQSHRIVQQLQARSNNGGASSSSGSNNSSSNPAVKCQAVLALGWQASLLEDSAFLGKACGWAQLCSDYLRHEASSSSSSHGHQNAKEKFQRIPAGLVKAMCEVWIRAAYHAGRGGGRGTNDSVLSGVMAADAALFCTEMMRQPELVSSPVVQDKLLAVVDAFVRTAPQSAAGGASNNNGGSGAAAGSPVYHGHNRGLAGAIMDNQRIRQELAPALMLLYSSCHAVAGLDVDDDVSFDKFNIRHRANALLVHLWKHPLREPRDSVLAFAGVARSKPKGGEKDGGDSSMENREAWHSFVIAALDTIMYNFDDCMRRMTDGRESERAAEKATKAQSGASTSSSSSSSSPSSSTTGTTTTAAAGQGSSSSSSPLSKPPPVELSDFLKQQQRTAKGFVQRSDSTLDLLCNLAGDSPMLCRTLSEGTLGKRTALVLYACLDRLCSADKADDWKVAEPEKWGLALPLALSRPATLLAHILDASTNDSSSNSSPLRSPSKAAPPTPSSSSSPSFFLTSLLNAPDFDLQTLRAAAATNGGEVLQKHLPMIEEAATAAIAGDTSAVTIAATGSSNMVQDNDNGNKSDGGNEGSGSSSSSSSSSTLSSLASTLANSSNASFEDMSPEDWVKWLGDEATSPEAYCAAIENEEQVCSVDGGFTPQSHFFVHEHTSKKKNSAAAGGGGEGAESSGGAVKALIKEYKKLMKGQLPEPHPNACIVIRYDDTKPQYCRAIVTGPADTPYFGGAFVFDIYFPSSYPQVPPLVQLVTTGQGQCRFNPNLYADGKVCLSVLGTWHGHESEKWNPKQSSLYQVLLSIQTQILVAEPYFNEPGMEHERSNTEARARSLRTNQGLRLDTLRHAINDLLQEEALLAQWPELKGVLVQHFSGIRRHILQEVKDQLPLLDKPAANKLFKAANGFRALLQRQRPTSASNNASCTTHPGAASAAEGEVNSDSNASPSLELSSSRPGGSGGDPKRARTDN